MFESFVFGEKDLKAVDSQRNFLPLMQYARNRITASVAKRQMGAGARFSMVRFRFAA